MEALILIGSPVCGLMPLQAQEVHEPDLAIEARSFHGRVKEVLMERGNGLASLEMRALEGDKIGMLSERSGKRRTTAGIPHHLLREGTDGASSTAFEAGVLAVSAYTADPLSSDWVRDATTRKPHTPHGFSG
jgi:hypothetical protein